MLLCWLICTLTSSLILFLSRMNYDNFAYTAHASSNVDGPEKEDRPYGKMGEDK